MKKLFSFFLFCSLIFLSTIDAQPVKQPNSDQNTAAGQSSTPSSPSSNDRTMPGANSNNDSKHTADPQKDRKVNPTDKRKDLYCGDDASAIVMSMKLIEGVNFVCSTKDGYKVYVFVKDGKVLRYIMRDPKNKEIPLNQEAAPNSRMKKNEKKCPPGTEPVGTCIPGNTICLPTGTRK